MKLGIKVSLIPVFVVTSLSIISSRAQPFSSEVQHEFATAQHSIERNDWQGAVSRLQKVLVARPLTPYEKFYTNRYLAAAYLTANDFVRAAPYAEAAAEYPNIPADQLVPTMLTAIPVSVSQKHYDKAIRYTELVGFRNPGLNAITKCSIAYAYFYSGDYRTAKKVSEEYIEGSDLTEKQSLDLLNIVTDSRMKLSNRPAVRKRS
jgi:tetratricopeptide (TPR) repeat protein